MRDATVAIVPIRSIQSGKTRLAGLLTPEERANLTAEMMRGVIGAALDAPEVANVVVVSPDQETLDLAADIDPRVIPLQQLDQPGGLDAAVAQGYAELSKLGASNVMILFGDLPYLDRDDIRTVLRKDAPIVIGPDQANQGTNVLLIRLGNQGDPARQFQFSYGPGSYQRHVAHAHELGLDVATVISPGIAFDLDTPDDLSQLRLMSKSA